MTVSNSLSPLVHKLSNICFQHYSSVFFIFPPIFELLSALEVLIERSHKHGGHTILLRVFPSFRLANLQVFLAGFVESEKVGFMFSKRVVDKTFLKVRQVAHSKENFSGYRNHDLDFTQLLIFEKTSKESCFQVFPTTLHWKISFILILRSLNQSKQNKKNGSGRKSLKTTLFISLIQVFFLSHDECLLLSNLQFLSSNYAWQTMHLCIF